MHLQPFLHRSAILVEKCPFWWREFQTYMRFRLRGIWRYAQDTVPIRACFLNNPKGLRTLGTVSPSVTVRESSKNLNKNSVSASDG